MSGRNLIWAAIVSAVVSIPMAFVSITVVQVDGSWSDIVSHPGFWIFLARACGWYFVAGFLASALTLFVTSRKTAEQP